VTLYTIGHSTRSLEEFLSVLRKYGIRCVLDVRRYPSSKKFPHFNRGELEKSLAGNAIRYIWMERLGGRRHGQANPDSPNAGLRSPAFRNYADSMQTEEFRDAVNSVLDDAKTCPTAIMCAERLYFRCHRMLISDYLKMLGAEVLHVGTGASFAEDKPIAHSYTSAARVRSGILTYSELRSTKSDLLREEENA
jgi:uncharacterized protein (DUF488 family)